MYKFNQSKIKNEDGKEFDTYGIGFYNIVIKDISVNKGKVEKPVILCNDLNLSPIHIVDDFLFDFNV